jgi:hypothetical protein
MERKTIYRHREIYKLCDGGANFCDIDFSSISFDDYEGLFNGLPNVVYKKAEGLRFSRDLDVKRVRADEALTDTEKRRLSDSIAVLRDRFEHYLFKILNQTLPRSKGLNRLVISGLKVPTKYFRDFIPACARCKTLRRLRIDGVNILDELAELIFTTLSPYRLEQLSLVDCNISSGIYEKVTEFLTQGADDPGARVWRLKVLDLRENLFTPEQLREVERLLTWRRSLKAEPDRRISSHGSTNGSHHASQVKSGHGSSSSSSHTSRSSSHQGSRASSRHTSHVSSRHTSHAGSRSGSRHRPGKSESGLSRSTVRSSSRKAEDLGSGSSIEREEEEVDEEESRTESSLVEPPTSSAVSAVEDEEGSEEESEEEEVIEEEEEEEEGESAAPVSVSGSSLIEQSGIEEEEDIEEIELAEEEDAISGEEVVEEIVEEEDIIEEVEEEDLEEVVEEELADEEETG